MILYDINIIVKIITISYHLYLRLHIIIAEGFVVS